MTSPAAIKSRKPSTPQWLGQRSSGAPGTKESELWREVTAKERTPAKYSQPPELPWTIEDAVREEAKAVQRYNMKLAANKESLRKYGPPEPKPRTVASPEKRAAMKRLRKLEKSLGAERMANGMLEEEVKLRCGAAYTAKDMLRWTEKQPGGALP